MGNCMAKFEYRIEDHSGRGTGYLEILKMNRENYRVFVLYYRDGNPEPLRDEEGNAWRLIDPEFEPERAFFGMDDDYSTISEEDVEKIIKEREETGKCEWRCPGLWIAAEGESDEKWWEELNACIAKEMKESKEEEEMSEEELAEIMKEEERHMAMYQGYLPPIYQDGHYYRIENGKPVQVPDEEVAWFEEEDPT